MTTKMKQGWISTQFYEPALIATLLFFFFCCWTFAALPIDRFYGVDFLVIWGAACRFVSYGTSACSGTWTFYGHNAPQHEIAEYAFHIYPPGLLFLTVPLTYLSPEKAFRFYFLLSAIAASLSVGLCLKLSELKSSLSAVRACIIAVFTFGALPFDHAFTIGQQSPFLLLAFVGYLFALDRHAPAYITGTLLGFLAVKPQAFVLLLLLVLRRVRERNYRADLLWCMIVLTFLHGSALAIHPELLKTSHMPLARAMSIIQPNLGTWLVYLTQISFLRFVPLVLSLVLIILKPPIITARTVACYIQPWSLMATPYCGLYDFISLLPCVFYLGRDLFLSTSFIRAFLILTVPVIANWTTTIFYPEEHFFFWVPAVFLVCSYGVWLDQKCLRRTN